MPQNLINAFVAIEDKRFFDHGGVDFYRTAGAAANYILGFDKRFGASTITQQLIKNVSGKNDISVKRKIQEILWALDLERKMDKNAILENYLNVINLSQGCYGVGAAADVYYSKKPSELTLSECATIAAITNSPTYYNPIRNPENNKTRRNLILDEMLSQGYVDESEYLDAYNSDIELNVNEAAIN
jgi:penicillin-binding protein 1A